jgi:hypothetical protein
VEYGVTMTETMRVWVAADANETRFRAWDEAFGGFRWTTTQVDALWFARRADVEKVFAEDEDTWKILSFDVLMPSTHGEKENQK